MLQITIWRVLNSRPICNSWLELLANAIPWHTPWHAQEFWLERSCSGGPWICLGRHDDLVMKLFLALPPQRLPSFVSQGSCQLVWDHKESTAKIFLSEPREVSVLNTSSWDRLELCVSSPGTLTFLSSVYVGWRQAVTALEQHFFSFSCGGDATSPNCKWGAFWVISRETTVLGVDITRALMKVSSGLMSCDCPWIGFTETWISIIDLHTACHRQSEHPGIHTRWNRCKEQRRVKAWEERFYGSQTPAEDWSSLWIITDLQATEIHGPEENSIFGGQILASLYGPISSLPL